MFNSKNEVVYAYYSLGEEGYSNEEKYYFDNRKLFFVYSEICAPNYETEEFTQDCFQSRTYLYNEEVFDCLFKEITESELKKAKEILEISKKSE